MNKWQAQYAYWSQFGIPAYEETNVPDATEVVFPYLTYQAVGANFNDTATVNASIWTKSTSWKQAMDIADAIQAELGYGGSVINYDDGRFWLQAASNFAQTMGDPNDDAIRRVLLTVRVQF